MTQQANLAVITADDLLTSEQRSTLQVAALVVSHSVEWDLDALKVVYRAKDSSRPCMVTLTLGQPVDAVFECALDYRSDGGWHRSTYEITVVDFKHQSHMPFNARSKMKAGVIKHGLERIAFQLAVKNIGAQTEWSEIDRGYAHEVVKMFDPDRETVDY